jgi:hypothetical protein
LEPARFCLALFGMKQPARNSRRASSFLPSSFLPSSYPAAMSVGSGKRAAAHDGGILQLPWNMPSGILFHYKIDPVCGILIGSKKPQAVRNP